MLNIPNQLFWCDNQEIHLGLVIFSVKAWVSLAFPSFWWFPAASVHIRHVWIILYNTTNSTVVQWTIFYTCRTCRTMYTYMYTTNYYVKCISCISYISYIPMLPMSLPFFSTLSISPTSPGESRRAPEQDRPAAASRAPALLVGSDHHGGCRWRWSRHHGDGPVLPMSLWSELQELLGSHKKPKWLMDEAWEKGI